MLQAVEVFFASLYAFIKLIVLDVATAFQDGELFFMAIPFCKRFIAHHININRWFDLMGFCEAVPIF
ncbi:hypothetical protein BN439_3306 [Erwinia amylovora Ea644]|nr:hypothetical protein BN439_3306 [Erwinia amylovora Ea644]